MKCILKSSLALSFLFLLTGLVGCKKESTPSICGVWKETVSSNDEQFSSFAFLESGEGCYHIWKSTGANSAISQKELQFSWAQNNNVLTLDFGFGYLSKYEIEYLLENDLGLLDLKPKGSYLSYKRWDLHYGSFKDIPMQMVGKIRFTDTRIGSTTLLSLRSDYSFGATYSSDTNETGTYAIDHSRIRFSSNETGKLNGRTYLITDINNETITLEDEDGVSIVAVRQ